MRGRLGLLAGLGPLSRSRGERTEGVPEDQPVEVLGDDGRIGPESLELDERVSEFPLGEDQVG